MGERADVVQVDGALAVSAVSEALETSTTQGEPGPVEPKAARATPLRSKPRRVVAVGKPSLPGRAAARVAVDVHRCDRDVLVDAAHDLATMLVAGEAWWPKLNAVGIQPIPHATELRQRAAQLNSADRLREVVDNERKAVRGEVKAALAAFRVWVRRLGKRLRAEMKGTKRDPDVGYLHALTGVYGYRLGATCDACRRLCEGFENHPGALPNDAEQRTFAAACQAHRDRLISLERELHRADRVCTEAVDRAREADVALRALLVLVQARWRVGEADGELPRLVLGHGTDGMRRR